MYVVIPIMAAVAGGGFVYYFYLKWVPDDLSTAKEESAPKITESESSLSSNDEADPEERKAKRCTQEGCRKKIALIGYKCRCGRIYCSKHRNAEEHKCTFDYKTAGKQEITKNNPKVEADKIKKF